jgi:hypothetical protein
MKRDYVFRCPACKRKLTRHAPSTQRTWKSYCSAADRSVRLVRVR